jgi:hypothetical protein
MTHIQQQEMMGPPNLPLVIFDQALSNYNRLLTYNPFIVDLSIILACSAASTASLKSCGGARYGIERMELLV